MTYLVVSTFILSLAVRHWPGQLPTQWISTWIDRVWLLVGVAFAAGLVLAFFTVATTPLPGGGSQHTLSIPPQVWYAFAAISVPLAMLAILGALQIARSEVRAFSRERARAWARGGRLRTVGIWLGVALAAGIVFWSMGEVALSTSDLNTNDDNSKAVRFYIGVIALIVCLQALVLAWRVAIARSDRP